LRNIEAREGWFLFAALKGSEMQKHEISASWFGAGADAGVERGRFAAIVEDDGSASFLVDGVTGQVAHISIRSSMQEVVPRPGSAEQSASSHVANFCPQGPGPASQLLVVIAAQAIGASAGFVAAYVLTRGFFAWGAASGPWA
jgi:hypothetical protein